MRVLPGGRGGALGKPVLATIDEALLALSLDKLGAAYVGKDVVFVMTVHGAGSFPRAEWEAAKKTTR